jgi:hypothetical protein
MEKEPVTSMKMLLEEVRKASDVDQLKAEQAVSAMMGFLGARLPSPIMGRIKEALCHADDLCQLGNDKK